MDISEAFCFSIRKGYKTFCHWFVATDRLEKSPLGNLHKLNDRLDRRHDRRALSDEEFTRLIEATEHGSVAVGLSGPDRTMLYIFAAWTGFRWSELGSLTLKSFDLQADPPVVRIMAACSKHRREDVQVLYPDLVIRLTQWIAKKRFREFRLIGDPREIFLKLQQKQSLLYPFQMKMRPWRAGKRAPPTGRKRYE